MTLSHAPSAELSVWISSAFGAATMSSSPSSTTWVPKLSSILAPSIWSSDSFGASFGPVGVKRRFSRVDHLSARAERARGQQNERHASHSPHSADCGTEATKRHLGLAAVTVPRPIVHEQERQSDSAERDSGAEQHIGG